MFCVWIDSGFLSSSSSSLSPSNPGMLVHHSIGLLKTAFLPFCRMLCRLLDALCLNWCDLSRCSFKRMRCRLRMWSSLCLCNKRQQSNGSRAVSRNTVLLSSSSSFSSSSSSSFTANRFQFRASAFFVNELERCYFSGALCVSSACLD